MKHTTIFKNILPSLVVCLTLIVAGGITYALYSFFTPPNEVLSVTTPLKPTATPQVYNAVPLISHAPTLSTPKTYTTQPVTPTLLPTTVPTAIINEVKTTTETQTTTTTTPTPTQLVVVTASPTNQVTIHMEIKMPDTTQNVTVDYVPDMNVCEMVQKAKDQGQLSSVTFDDSYLSNLHSRYVSEMNGLKNNWTFTVNGSAPLGCSLSHPQPNDTIVWKFG